MTAIAIKDGVLAVDTYIGANGLRCGYVQKWREVPHWHGGGYVAGSGNFGPAMDAIDRLVCDGVFTSADECTILWLRGDGAVFEAYDKSVIQYDAPFYCAGSAEALLRGALAAGASAEQAVRIACDWMDTCGGEVHVLSVRGDNSD